MVAPGASFTLTSILSGNGAKTISPYPPGALHPPVKGAGERFMSNPFLAGRQRNTLPQFLFPPGEENRGMGLYRERKIEEGVFLAPKD
jgi:hypothetical protein